MKPTHHLTWLGDLPRLISAAGLVLGLGFLQVAEAATYSADSNLTTVDTRAPGLPVTISGRVFDRNGSPVVGAKVAMTVFQTAVTETLTDAAGAYRLKDLTPQVATLSASMVGMRTDSRVVSVGPTTRQDFQLIPDPVAFLTQAASGPAPVTYERSPEAAEGSRLLVFDGTNFTDNIALLDKSKMLTVLTHGWISRPAAWALPMAKAMAEKGITANVNIVAWDWQGAAARFLPLPEEKTPAQGIALGQALQATLLGEEYSQPVHFIGHSLGTLVNRYAVDYLRGESTGTQPRASRPWPGFRPHLTLFDEAEVGHLIGPTELARLVTGGDVVSRVLVNLFITQNYGPDAPHWKRPIPKTPGASLWIDNYVSAFGLSHGEAFNVCLQFALLHDPFHLGHSYPQQWYQRSVAHPTFSQAGFRRSDEQRRKDPTIAGDFPPGSPLLAGALFHQTPSIGEELELEPVPLFEVTECFFPVFGGAAIGRKSRLAVETAIVAKDIAVESVRLTKDAAVTAYDVTTDSLTAAYDYVGSKANAGVDAVWNFATQPGLRLDLKGEGPTPGSRAGLHDGAVEPSTYGIVRLTVPSEADLFSFDYLVSGDSPDGVVVFGIGSTNLLSQPQSVVPRDERQTSPLFPVQTVAGQTNDFFFGLADTTTTNVTVQIQGFRFYSLRPPQLTVALAGTGSGVVLSWPSTANGYFVELATNLASPTWKGESQSATLYGGRFSVTNAIAGEERYYRLRKD